MSDATAEVQPAEPYTVALVHPSNSLSSEKSVKNDDGKKLEVHLDEAGPPEGFIEATFNPATGGYSWHGD